MANYYFKLNYYLMANYCILNMNLELHTGNLLKIFNRSNTKYMIENNDCRSLVIYGSNLESSVNLPKFSRIVSYMIGIPNNILSPLIGLILSDGNLEFVSKKTLSNNYSRKSKSTEATQMEKNIYSNVNSRFRFKQSFDHLDYLFFVFNILSPYCISFPKLVKTRINRRDFIGLEFITRALPCFTYLRDIFYRGRIKIIPENLYDLLTYEGLAHIIMSDGSFKSKAILINLQSFTVKELILFMNVLRIKFELKPTLHKSRDSYTVYIPVDSVKILHPKIKKYIIPSMRYKFDKLL